MLRRLVALHQLRVRVAALVARVLADAVLLAVEVELRPGPLLLRLDALAVLHHDRLQAVSLGLLEDHVSHCVVDAARESDEAAQAKVREASDAIARLVRS